jgi:hypothetical protein
MRQGRCTSEAIRSERPNKIDRLLARLFKRRLPFIGLKIIYIFVSAAMLGAVWAAFLGGGIFSKHGLSPYDWLALMPYLVAPPVMNTFLIALLGSALTAIFVREDPLCLSILLTPFLTWAQFALSAEIRAFTAVALMASCLHLLVAFEKRRWLDGYFFAAYSQVKGNFFFVAFNVVGAWFALIF